MHGERFVHRAQHPLLHRSGGGDVVVAVHQDLGLHDRHQPLLLHGAGVAGQAPGVLPHRQLGGAAIGADLQHGPPFGKAGAALVVAGSAVRQALEARAPALPRQASGEGFHPLIHLDAGHDALALKQLHQGRAARLGGAVLKQGFLKQDHAGNALGEAVGGGQQGAVSAAVVLGVVEADGPQPLADGAGGFVRRQQPTAWGRQGGGGGRQLLAKCLQGHGGKCATCTPG